MFGANQPNDKALLKSVTQRLARGTGSQTRTTAMVQSGTVTLSGVLRYEAQRIPIVKEVGRIAGVRRVVDLLTVTPKMVYSTGPVAPPAPAPAEEVIVLEKVEQAESIGEEAV